MNRFKELLNISFKSEDTEEWLDVYFTRPIGLVFATVESDAPDWADAEREV